MRVAGAENVGQDFLGDEAGESKARAIVSAFGTN